MGSRPASITALRIGESRSIRSTGFSVTCTRQALVLERFCFLVSDTGQLPTDHGEGLLDDVGPAPGLIRR